MTHAVPRVFIVDDDVSIREALLSLCQCIGWRSEAFASAEEFLARSACFDPCCLILDVRLPELDGLELQSRLAVEHAHVPVIFITGHGDVPMTVRAMKAGAVEFLTKPFVDEVVIDAIRNAFERSTNALHHASERQALRKRYTALSSREREVMAIVVSGLLNKQVGGELGISEVTVKAHRGQVMRKMKADSFAALVYMAAELGMTGCSVQG